MTGSSISLFSLFIINTLKLFRLIDSKYRLALNLVFGYLFIGLHQFFEFLSIYTGNSIIYRFGLIFSIGSMIFNFKATEIMLGKNLKLKYIYLSLAVLIIHLITREIIFSNSHFYVRGESHFYWGALWLIYFLYWNFIHYQAFKLNTSLNRKFALELPFMTLNFSFIMAAVYCYSFGFFKNFHDHQNITKYCGGLLTNFEIVFDAPSIWCCFATIQGIFLYRFLKELIKAPITLPICSNQISLIKSFLLSIISVIFIFITLPFFSALSYKMILK